MSDALTSPYVLEYAYKRSTGPVVGAFLTGLRGGRLLGARTGSGVVCPPTEYDPHTGAPAGELVEVGPGGVVTTWTWVAEPRPNHPLQHPFAWALVRLDGADTALLHALDAGTPDRVRTGMRVTPRWSERREGHLRDLCFVPEEGSATAVDDLGVGEAPITRFRAPVRLDYVITASAPLRRFLHALTERRIVGARCPETGLVHVPAPAVLPANGRPPAELVDVAHTGTVTTFCVVNIPFEGQVLKPPYVGAAILLDGADVPLFHLVGGDPAEVRMGLRVRAVWEDEPRPSLATILCFAPTGEPDAPYASYAEHL